MCLITHKPKGEKFEWEYIKHSHNRGNNRGWGAMYCSKNRLVTVRGMGDTKEIKAALEPHEDRQIVLHQRLPTHGSNNLDMTHPFKVLSIDDGDPLDIWMVHNGVLSFPCIFDSHSDTWHFVEYIKPFIKENPNIIYDGSFLAKLGKLIHATNKLVFMTNRGQVLYVNKQAGTVVDKLWYSNTYSIPYKSATTYYGQRWENGKWVGDNDVKTTGTKIQTLDDYRASKSYTSGVTILTSTEVRALTTLPISDLKTADITLVSKEMPIHEIMSANEQIIEDEKAAQIAAKIEDETMLWANCKDAAKYSWTWLDADVINRMTIVDLEWLAEAAPPWILGRYNVQILNRQFDLDNGEPVNLCAVH